MHLTTSQNVGGKAALPTVLPLLSEGDDGTEQVAGWLFVLDDEVVSYLSQPGRCGHAVGVFSSVDSAAHVLACGGIWLAPTSEGDLLLRRDGSWR